MTTGIRPNAAIRASSTQDTFRHLDQFRPGLGGEVASKLPPGYLDRLMGAARTSWLPFEEDIPFAETAYAHLGHDEAKAFWTDFVVAHIAGSPLVSGAARTALRLFGSTPGALFKWYPKVAPTVFRDVFDVRLEALEEREARLVFENVDARYIGREVYLLTLECMGYGFFRTTKHEGSVKVAADTSLRQIRLVGRW